MTGACPVEAEKDLIVEYLERNVDEDDHDDDETTEAKCVRGAFDVRRSKLCIADVRAERRRPKKYLRALVLVIVCDVVLLLL